MDLTQIFLSGIKIKDEFTEAVDIVKRNSSGKIWLIGGFVYRTIASELYKSTKPKVDFDFLVEDSVLDFNLPLGWRVDYNRFGNPKLIKSTKQIDYVPLKKVYSITQRNIEPTIENFLTGVPLKVQSIAYDIYNNQIIGQIGIDALQRKVVQINDVFFAEYASQKKNISLREMIKEKADSLGFTPIFLESEVQNIKKYNN
jgi:hypothetical protein